MKRVSSQLGKTSAFFLTPDIIWRHFPRNKVLKKPARSNEKWDQREKQVMLPNLRMSGQRIDIKVLVKKVAEKYNVSLGELQSDGRRRGGGTSKARNLVDRGIRELGYSGSDGARYRMVSATEKPDIADIIWCYERPARTFPITNSRPKGLWVYGGVMCDYPNPEASKLLA